MKYREMTPQQQDAFRGLLLNVLSIRSQEEQQYTQQFFRLLVLGNGAGIALLATFMGAVAGQAARVALLVSPLIKFFFGAVLAALVFFPLMAVASKATIHIGEQVNKFFLNQLDVEQFQGYGLNRVGRVAVNLLLIISLILFSVGVYQCIGILRGV